MCEKYEFMFSEPGINTTSGWDKILKENYNMSYGSRATILYSCSVAVIVKVEVNLLSKQFWETHVIATKKRTRINHALGLTLLKKNLRKVF